MKVLLMWVINVYQKKRKEVLSQISNHRGSEDLTVNCRHEEHHVK